MKNKKRASKENPFILWKDLLDLGINLSFIFLKKRRSEQEALKELRASLIQQSEEHWQGLYNAFKKLK